MLHWRVDLFIFFFFNDTATTEIYTLSLHDALPICPFGPAHGYERPGPLITAPGGRQGRGRRGQPGPVAVQGPGPVDRKSTRLNSSHLVISYAVFCLKKKKNTPHDIMSHRPSSHIHT